MKKIIFANHAPKQRLSVSAVLTAYYFDVSDEAQAAQYWALVEARRAAGLTPWDSHMPVNASPEKTRFFAHWDMIDNLAGRPKMQAGLRPLVIPHGTWAAPVTIEIKHLFDNQMNSAAPTNARLFDWSKAVVTNKNIKHGYWIESAELEQARATTCACGYCGAQYENGTPGEFCSQCIDSEHLDIATLHLLRLQMVNDKRNRAKLTEAERAELLPIFEKARTEGMTARGIARIAKQRADIFADYEKTIEKATIERDGKLWCNDNGIDTYHAIYYSHTKRWAFNWQENLKGDELARLVEKVKTFPFAFDVK